MAVGAGRGTEKRTVVEAGRSGRTVVQEGRGGERRTVVEVGRGAEGKSAPQGTGSTGLGLGSRLAERKGSRSGETVVTVTRMEPASRKESRAGVVKRLGGVTATNRNRAPLGHVHVREISRPPGRSVRQSETSGQPPTRGLGPVKEEPGLIVSRSAEPEAPSQDMDVLEALLFQEVVVFNEKNKEAEDEERSAISQISTLLRELDSLEDEERENSERVRKAHQELLLRMAGVHVLDGIKTLLEEASETGADQICEKTLQSQSYLYLCGHQSTDSTSQRMLLGELRRVATSQNKELQALLAIMEPSLEELHGVHEIFRSLLDASCEIDCLRRVATRNLEDLFDVVMKETSLRIQLKEIAELQQLQMPNNTLVNL
uniref:Uncharacterized protein n=1 Tax=Compsopogon caeruleus TaxID=31354 RepID=A0A7S1TGY9_9RHOD